MYALDRFDFIGINEKRFRCHFTKWPNSAFTWHLCRRFFKMVGIIPPLIYMNVRKQKTSNIRWWHIEIKIRLKLSYPELNWNLGINFDSWCRSIFIIFRIMYYIVSKKHLKQNETNYFGWQFEIHLTYRYISLSKIEMAANFVKYGVLYSLTSFSNSFLLATCYTSG